MNNFGVIEIASAKTTSAPGWAYVPDTRPGPGSAALPSNRKRARNPPGGALSLRDLSARQDARIRKEVEALDRDGGRDNSIPVPVKSGRATGKSSLNVRKILQSQKTFANHLDDFLAFQAQADGNTNNTNAAARPAASQANQSKRSAPARKDSATPAAKQTQPDEDIPMTDDLSRPPILPQSYDQPLPADAGDGDPLLASRVPKMPTDEALRTLLAQPPLSYREARGHLDDTYPRRNFCEVCGYWGRVRCMKCGTRLCALDCLETHREECVTRYGL